MWEQLMETINNGDIAKALDLIQKMGIEEFEKDCSALHSSEIPLHQAINKNLTSVVEAILDKKPELINQVDNSGYTPLHGAARQTDSQIALKLLDKYTPDLQIVDVNGYIPFMFAVQNSSKEVIDKMLSKDSSLPGFVGTRNGYTPLHLAAQYGTEQTVTELLNVDPDLAEKVSINGVTPLHCASRREDITDPNSVSISESISTQILDAAPALINAVDNDGITPAHRAAQSGNNKTLLKLLKINPDLIDAQDKKGYLPLNYASLTKGGKLNPVIETMLKQKPELADKKDPEGWTLKSKIITNDLVRLDTTQSNKASGDNYNLVLSANTSGYFIIAGVLTPEILIALLRFKDKKSDDPIILGFLKGALNFFTEEIDKNTGEANILADNYFKKANILYALGKKEEATICYKEVLKQNFNYVHFAKDKGIKSEFIKLKFNQLKEELKQERVAKMNVENDALLEAVKPANGFEEAQIVANPIEEKALQADAQPKIGINEDETDKVLLGENPEMVS